MQAEITAAFLALCDEPAVGAIVVTGEGRGFMAGADIKEYAAQTPAEFDAFQAAGTAMYAAIEDNRKPVIAAVNGYALGGGMELVLCADLVIAIRIRQARPAGDQARPDPGRRRHAAQRRQARPQPGRHAAHDGRHRPGSRSWSPPGWSTRS